MRSILLVFLELTGTLALDPSLAEAKLADLRTLFLNAHHLVNEYRPHQARETVIEMVAEQVRKRRDEIEGVRRMQGKVDEVFGALTERGAKDEQAAATMDGVGNEMARESLERQRQRMADLWTTLDEIEV